MAGRRLLEVVGERLRALRSRVRRIERRELSEFRRWIQNTTNLLHLSIVLFVPVVIGLVTYLSNQIQTLSFLLFPPLASGTYTLVSDPEGPYADPVRFVASLSAGGFCGLAAHTATGWVYGGIGGGSVLPESAALAIFLTGLVTWAADIEAPSAFSTALLALVTGDINPAAYVVSIILAASVVAIAFVVWREAFYEQRARFLYDTVRGDDHVLVPLRGEAGERTAFFGAWLAAAHDAGKVVLCEVVESDENSSVDAESHSDGESSAGAEQSLTATTDDRVRRLEAIASMLRTKVGIPCEVVVVAGDPARATIEAAQTANCDLIVTPYEEENGALSGFVRSIFNSRIDSVAFRSAAERRRWNRVLVLVSRPGDTAHAMIDFGSRLTRGRGTVSVTTCIDSEGERRRAETHLDHLVETVDASVETRVARSSVDDFIAANADSYDLLVLGSSGDRSPVSRLVSPPTFRRVRDLECDVAVFDRGAP
ncbi:universal stress protein [Halobellus ordinarius]|uniref:universal stress protein n=1 Tax=Halobellus ordinarius TaxID=3075120 RepID=UPI0028804C45|nr:universal stress protein [Halobellus sp. ZY16]